MRQILLNDAESELTETLLKFCDYFSTTYGQNLTLRYAGGWVRDKLLNRESHDIDVAIDQTTGADFAQKFSEYLETQTRGEKKIGVHKIACNPAKSKHLETATANINGLDIDFVNLRSEEYANESRVPTDIKFGTPMEDAMRRDATLNALFYNLQTKQIEDFTKRGIDDLENGVLRTPLEPSTTFQDDPLRVLRLLRFSAQLQFTIAEDALAAMHADQIGELLLKKVSNERVGIEMTKLLESKDPVRGLNYLADLHLEQFVFSKHVRHFKDKINSVVNNCNVELRGENACVLWLAVILQDHEFEDLKGENTVNVILGSKLVTTKTVKNNVLTLLKSTNHFNAEFTRLECGHFVINCGDLWELCLLFNCILSGSDYKLCVDRVKGMGLENAHKLKPLLSGKQLMALLDRKGGPWLTDALKLSVDMQIENPDVSMEEVEQVYKQKYT